MVIKHHKFVGALPSTLDPDAFYCLRTGAGFDLYVSDATGAFAHALNHPQWQRVSTQSIGDQSAIVSTSANDWRILLGTPAGDWVTYFSKNQLTSMTWQEAMSVLSGTHETITELR